MKIEELFSVRGKVALVTGGSRGLGEMIARAYVENGAKVYITARKAEACEALAKELSQFGECIAIPADLSRMDEIARLAGEVHKREKKLDILVNNAGASWGATFAEFPENGWDKVMDLNVKSVFFLTQSLLALLEAAVKVRRRVWQGREVQLDAEGWSTIADRMRTPHADAETREVIDALQQAIREALSPHQREVLVALTLEDVPIDVLAARLGSTRGALYKTLHDARRKLRVTLAAQGLEVDPRVEARSP